jgi:prevent-host-death family protein
LINMEARVGIRELRQHLTRYLRRVADGETLTVTEHGRPVAMLAPLPSDQDPLERLIAEGRATRPQGDLIEFLESWPRGEIDFEGRGSKALQEQRGEPPD